MSFTEVLAELPALSVAERQLLIRRALDLDDAELSEEDLAVVERRLADHHQRPESAVSLDEMKKRLRARFMR
jgi:putative addiction module component (TIGR02574 family)